MKEVKDIFLGQVMHVVVHRKGEQLPVTYTALDSGEGAWKEENSQVLVHQINLTGDLAGRREPRWINVGQRQDIEKIDVRSFMESLAKG